MSFYNRRLVALGKRRWQTGHFGRRNAGWRELYDGFTPDRRLWRLFAKALCRWGKCELINLGLLFSKRVNVIPAQASPPASAKACEV
jgi:hypothetical protein